MAQHDYVLDNATGAAFRSDLNDALSAIVSLNAGTDEPSTTFAGMLWIDTTNSLLKLRNQANNAWVTLGSITAANLGLLPLAGGTLTGAILAAVAGSDSAPDIAFSGDANTGMRRTAADKLALIAGGVQYLLIDGATADNKGLTLGGTAFALLPVGTSAQRPSSPSAGMIRYNSDLSQFEGYKGGTWGSMGGGGGGAGFTWRGISGTAPTEAEENGEVVKLFAPGAAQELYAAIKIPQSYSAGSPVSLYVSAYSPASSGTQLFKAQATLIRSGTDAFDSTTNQRTTTNSALTNTVASQLREHTLDVTDTDGTINSVAVSAGDIIKVRLYRDATDTDADTDGVRLLANATDVKFS